MLICQAPEILSAPMTQAERKGENNAIQVTIMQTSKRVVPCCCIDQMTVNESVIQIRTSGTPNLLLKWVHFSHHWTDWYTFFPPKYPFVWVPFPWCIKPRTTWRACFLSSAKKDLTRKSGCHRRCKDHYMNWTRHIRRLCSSVAFSF